MTAGDKIKLRAELAAKAMQGMLGNEYYTSDGATELDIARWAVAQADALMKELGLDGE